MNTVGKLRIAGVVDQNGRVTGHISAGNSIQGTLTGQTSVSGYLAVGTVIEAEANTFIIVDPEGNEIPAVLVDDELVVTATPNDVRKGVTAITNEGLIVGDKEIPSYYTNEGYRAVTKGSRFIIPHVDYDYTKLQAVICHFNKNAVNSVSAFKVALENNVYDVNSIEALSSIVKDDENAWIDLGITNDTDGICVIRYFMYKEIY